MLGCKTQLNNLHGEGFTNEIRSLRRSSSSTNYKKDTNSMSASDIINPTNVISPDETDLTKLSAEELLAVVAKLRQENKVLKKAKNKVGLTFKRIPEDGNDSIARLEAGDFPHLTKLDALSVTKEEQTDGNIALIEGENLAVLASLQMTHKGKVDVIYIDPPYNTGNDDFIYEDKRMYQSNQTDLENLEKHLNSKKHTVGKDDPYRHSKWLSFMERRLFLAKELLNDAGVIFVSIDDNEQARLKLLMDQIFGAENFRNIISVARQSKNLNQQFMNEGLRSLNTGSEYVLVYTTNPDKKLSPVFRVASDSRAEKGYWKGFWNGADRKTMRYDILGFTPSEGQWKWKESVAREAIQNYNEYLEKYQNTFSLEEYWKNTGSQLKFIKKNPKGSGKNQGVEHWVPPTDKILRTSNWNDILAAKSLPGVAFDSPKNPFLIKELINFSNSPKDAIILDFFAGSWDNGTSCG
jgi:adenine-specific DNA-methyltransferase